MRRMLEELGDLAVVEAPAKLEGKKLIMVVGPNPKAKKPSGGAKKEEKKPSEPKAEAKKEDSSKEDKKEA
jgi:hypothetical protein